MDIKDWSTDDWIENLARGSTEQRFQYCLDSTETCCIYVPFKVILKDTKLILHCRITCCYR